MRTKEETSKLDALFESIEFRTPHPSNEHSAEKSFSRLMTRIQTDNKSIDISANAPTGTGFGWLPPRWHYWLQ